MRALLLPKYSRMAASTRHRFLQYLPALQAAGIDCDVVPLFDDAYLERRFWRDGTPGVSVLAGFTRRIVTLLRASSYDIVVVYCELFPYFPRWVERLFSRARIPYVVDMDDAVFLRYDQPANRMLRWLWGNKFRRVLAEATLVMAGNEFLAAYARQSADWVEVVPTVVDTDRYGPADQKPGSDGRFTIGWIGSPSTSPYLDLVAESLKDVCDRTGARVVVVGAGDARWPGLDVVRRPWTEETEIDAIREFDVGIMPLPDTPWARGKCGFKLIQYMACGLPAVASPIGVNTELVEHGVSGFLATDGPAWISSLTALSADEDLRRRMGRAGRSKVEQHYSLHVVAPRVATLVRAAAEGRRSRVRVHTGQFS